MNIFNKLFNRDTEIKTVAPVEPEKKPKIKEDTTVTQKPKVKKKTDKELATERAEPWVSIIKVDLDPDNVGNGSFELDWNEFFVAKLVRSGYKGKDDAQIVDQWFQDICRNVVLETFEQYDANNPRPKSGVSRKDIGSGRSEIS